MLDKSKPMPLYYQLQELLLEKIEKKEYEVGEALPSEQELTEIYGVSRSTVRQAVNNLVEEGYLEKRRGVGTFVSSRHKKSYWQLKTLRSFKNEFEDQGHTVQTRVLDFKKVVPDQSTEVFKLFGNQELYEIDRLRCIDQTPVVLVKTYVPVYLLHNLEKYDLNHHSLFDLMQEEYGVVLSHATKEMSVRKARPSESQHLKIKEGDPIQLVKTFTYDSENRLVEFSSSKDSGHLSVYRVFLKYGD